MRKALPILIAIMFICSTAFAAGVGVYRDGNRMGPAAEIDFVGAQVDGKGQTKKTVDLSNLHQDSATGAVEVLELEQDDVSEPIFKFTATAAATNAVSCYTTTTSTKVGAIKVDVNGTTRWIQLFNDPD